MVYNTTDNNKELVKQVSRELEMNNKIVVCVCYGIATMFKTRTDAKRFFKQAIRDCEGCERERYMAVYDKLDEGWRVADDDFDNFDEPNQLLTARQVTKHKF